MHHPTDRITHTTAFVTPVVEHWLEREIAQWVIITRTILQLLQLVVVMVVVVVTAAIVVLMVVEVVVFLIFVYITRFLFVNNFINSYGNICLTINYFLDFNNLFQSVKVKIKFLH